MEEPTIYDILDMFSKWDRTPEESRKLLETGGYTPGGKFSMGKYISSLVEKSGNFGDTLFGEGAEGLQLQYTRPGYMEESPDRPFVKKDIDMEQFHRLYMQEGFQSMDKDELEASIMDFLSGDIEALKSEGRWETEQIYNEETEELEDQEKFVPKWDPESIGLGGDLDELIKYLSVMQEGLGSMVTPESWGLERKLGATEDASKREVSNLLESYLPTEERTRYGTLAGESPAEGELAEAEYLAQQFGGQRQYGRDVEDIYGEYGGDFFGRLNDFISNLNLS